MGHIGIDMHKMESHPLTRKRVEEITSKGPDHDGPHPGGAGVGQELVEDGAGIVRSLMGSVIRQTCGKTTSSPIRSGRHNKPV